MSEISNTMWKRPAHNWGDNDEVETSPMITVTNIDKSYEDASISKFHIFRNIESNNKTRS